MRRAIRTEILEPRRLFAAGDIDTTFGTGGKSTLDFTIPAEEYPTSVVVLSDGKFLVGHNSYSGTSSDVAAFSKHLANGTLDTSFGTGGKIRFADGWGSLGVEDMYVRSNGDIIALGAPLSGQSPVRGFTSAGVPLPTSSFNFTTSISTSRKGMIPLSGGGGLVLTGVAIHKFTSTGALDTTFGSSGTLSFPTVSNVAFRANNFAVDSTGAIYVVGYNLTTTTGVKQPAVAKLTSGGAFASGWGTNGVLTFSLLQTDGDSLSSVAIDSSNRPVVAGTDVGSPQRAIVARITTSGLMDTSFDGDGIEYFSPAAGSTSVASGDVVIDSTGRIILAGLYSSSSANTFFLARMTPTAGALDPTFAGDGIQESLLPSASGVQVWYGPPALDASNNVIMGIGTRAAVQNQDGDSTMFRINASNGVRDTTFGGSGNGTQVVSFVGSASNRTLAAVRQPDGKLVFAGYASTGVSGWLIGRLNANGSPDTGFGNNGDGTIRIDWATSNQIPTGIAIDSAGRAVITGWVADTNSSDTDAVILRLTTAGLPDSTFGTSGKSRRTVVSTNETANSVAFQSDGKLVVCGTVQASTARTRQAAVLRFNTDGTLDATFGASGQRILDPTSANYSYASDVFVVAGDAILVASGDEQSSPLLERRFAAKLTPSGALDLSYGTGGVAYANAFSEDIYIGNARAAVDSSGRLYVQGTKEIATDAWYDYAMVTRFTPGGITDTTFGPLGTGTVQVQLKSSSDTFSALGIDPFGRVVIGAAVNVPGSTTNSDMMIARLDQWGRTDTNFGTGGQQLVDVVGGFDTPTNFGFTTDEKLLALGYSSPPGGGTDYSAVRLSNLAPPAFPSWIGAGSAATWNPTSKSLTVGGAATLVADPATDTPVVVGSALSAVLTIAPSGGRAARLATLSLSGGASAAVPSVGSGRAAGSERMLIINSLSIDSTSKLDLADNDLVLDYSGSAGAIPANVEAFVRRGFNLGDWLGSGITSSVAAAPASNGAYALGVADNAGLVTPFGNGTTTGPQFAGQAVDGTCVLVKFTRRVDLNLDGLVNSNDAAIFNGAYTDGAAAKWASGDVNFDGVFNSNDAAIFNGAYNENLPALRPAGMSSFMGPVVSVVTSSAVDQQRSDLRLGTLANWSVAAAVSALRTRSLWSF